jgi:hypothetical protein
MNWFADLTRQGPRPSADPALGPGSFRRIVDVPFETGLAALAIFCSTR